MTGALPDKSAILTHPVVGGRYRHVNRRGVWRVEKVGRKWLTFRSQEVWGSDGQPLSFREAREDWPNGWFVCDHCGEPCDTVEIP